MPTSPLPDSTRANATPDLDVTASTEAPAPAQDTPLRTRRLHDRFELQAAATPAAEAVINGYQRVTYRELNDRANRIAHRLLSLGVGPETLVGVHLERSAEMIAALLGVLKAGAAYVPLDPIYPAERLAFILRDAQVHTVLTQGSLHDTLARANAAAGHDPICVCLDADEQLAYAATDNPASGAAPENLAYVLYAPGADAPKGVAIEHRNAVSFVQWAGDLYSPRELSGVLACTSIAFDPSILELFVPLSFGGKIILAENILALHELPAVDEIRLLDTVPSIAQELLRIGGLPPALETINLGGEPVPDRLVRQLYALPTIQRVYDQYGPVEATTIATCVLRLPKQPADIGRAIAGVQVHLLDHEQQPVPAGAIGELCIGGVGVARGYWNRPELTALKFIPDPFSGKPGARLYRTGDLCRRHADGRLEYVGRADEQVHIEGRHVKLGEIETALRTHPSVGEAMVMLRQDDPGRPRLVAYVVPQPAPEPKQSDLHLASEVCRYLRTRLPHHLLPALFTLLALFTLMSGARAERVTLHAPARLRAADYNTSFRVARGRTEDTVARIWSRIMGVKPVAPGYDIAAAGKPAKSRFGFGSKRPTVFRTTPITLDVPPEGTRLPRPRTKLAQRTGSRASSPSTASGYDAVLCSPSPA